MKVLLINGSPRWKGNTNRALEEAAAALEAEGVETELVWIFYAGGANFRFKPAAGVAVARRAGAIEAADQINKYFQINCQPLVSSSYWNLAYGRTPGEAEGDGEGLHTMRVLGRNMAWMLKCIEAGRAAGINAPEMEPKVMTNVVREDLLGE